jgi:hypothetical protein
VTALAPNSDAPVTRPENSGHAELGVGINQLLTLERLGEVVLRPPGVAIPFYGFNILSPRNRFYTFSYTV